MKNLKDLLNLQFAPVDPGSGGDAGGADPVVTTQPVQNNSPVSTAPVVDYNKIEQIVNKRASTATDSVLKGYLKQQGLSGEELDQAISSFKEQKQQAEIAKAQKEQDLEVENAQLKQQIMDSKIDTKLTSLAASEGISSDKMPFLLKLIERKDLVDEKGDVSEEKAKTALTAVLTAFPDLKGTAQQSTGFQQIGASSNANGKTTDVRAAAFQNGRIILPKK